MVFILKKCPQMEKKINCSKFKKIIYEKTDDNPFKFLKIEESMTDDVITSFELKHFPTNSNIFPTIKLDLLYEENLPISKEKFDDLQSLLQFIPGKYHNFYRSLKYTVEPKKDFALASRQSSDDEEEYFFVLFLSINKIIFCKFGGQIETVFL